MARGRRDTSLGWRGLALAPLAALAGLAETRSAQARMPELSAGTCRVETVRKEAYTICSFDPETTRFSIRLKGFDGQPYRKLAAATAEHPTVVFAMNGGMYHDDLAPVGLYVEDGSEGASLKRKRSWGNFGLVPNGVFWVKNGTVGVTETLAFDRRGVRPDFATQSGPMLVIDGKLHPKFLETSDSYKIRNGVGVSRDGRVHFAMSHGAVNFWTFAKLFQEHLETPNALFLDGTVSALRAKGFSRGGFWVSLGPIILAEPHPLRTAPTRPEPRPEAGSRDDAAGG